MSVEENERNGVVGGQSDGKVFSELGGQGEGRSRLVRCLSEGIGISAAAGIQIFSRLTASCRRYALVLPQCPAFVYTREEFLPDANRSESRRTRLLKV